MAAAPPVAAAVMIVLIAGCATHKPPPPPLMPPPLAASVRYRPGPPVGAAPTTQPAAAAVNVADALSVETEWHALSGVPSGLPPLLTAARLIEAPDAANPLLPTGRLTRDARLVPAEKIDALERLRSDAPPIRRASITTSHGVLARGATSAFIIAGEPPGENPALAPSRIEIAVHRAAAASASTTLPATAPTTTAASATTAPTGGGSGDVVQLAIAVRRVNIHVSGSPSEPAVENERILLDPRPLTELPMRMAVIIPARFDRSSRAVLAVIRIDRPDPADAAYQQTLARCQADLMRGGALAAIPSTTAPSIRDWPSMQPALNLLAEPSSARAAMVYLAGETDARLCGDVALAADDATITELARRISTHVAETPEKDRNIDRLAWVLESSALEQLTAMQTSEQLPPELAAVMSTFAGEAGRRPASLDELARAGSVDALPARIIAENFTYQEDSSPAARVRAFDWLASNGRAPPGYDPLGDAKRRRTSLDEAMTAAAKSSGGAP